MTRIVMRSPTNRIPLPLGHHLFLRRNAGKTVLHGFAGVRSMRVGGRKSIGKGIGQALIGHPVQSR